MNLKKGKTGFWGFHWAHEYIRRRERARMIHVSSVCNIASTELELIRQFKTLRGPIEVEGSIDEGRWVYWAKNTCKPDDVAMGRSAWKDFIWVFSSFNYFGSVVCMNVWKETHVKGKYVSLWRRPKCTKMFKAGRETDRQIDSLNNSGEESEERIRHINKTN